jgi:hypothetical protein
MIQHRTSYPIAFLMRNAPAGWCGSPCFTLDEQDGRCAGVWRSFIDTNTAKARRIEAVRR